MPAQQDGAQSEYKIVFDGGSLGNPGKGYGSYVIHGPDGYRVHERLTYGDDVTNNQAEYRTLIAALQRLRHDCPGSDKAMRVAVRGDSQLVINQVNGRWKVRNPGLAPLHREAVSLLHDFGAHDVSWHPRANSVRVLGH